MCAANNRKLSDHIMGKLSDFNKIPNDPYAGRMVKLITDLCDPEHFVSRDEIMTVDHQNPDGTVCVLGDDHFIGDFDPRHLIFLS